MSDGGDHHSNTATTTTEECAAPSSGFVTGTTNSDPARIKSEQTTPIASETGKDSALAYSGYEISKLADDTIAKFKQRYKDSVSAKMGNVASSATPVKILPHSSTFECFMQNEFKDFEGRLKKLEEQHEEDMQYLSYVVSILFELNEAHKELTGKKNRDDAEVQAQLEELRKCRSEAADCMRNSKTSQLSEVLKIVEGYISKQQSGEIGKYVKDLLQTIIASVKAEGKILEKVESEVQTEEESDDSILSNEYLWFRRTYREVNQQYMQSIEQLLEKNNDKKLKQLLSMCQEKMKRFDESAEKLLKSGLLKRAATNIGSERKIGELKRQIDQLSTEKQDLQKQLDGLITQQSQEKQQQAETLSAKESENQAMKTQIMSLERSITDKERIITEKEKMIQEKTNLILRQDNDLRKLENDCNRLKQKLVNAKKGKSDSDAVVAERDETIRTLQRDNDALHEQNEELRLQNEELRLQNDGLLDPYRLLREAGQMIESISRFMNASDVNDDEIAWPVLATQ